MVFFVFDWAAAPATEGPFPLFDLAIVKIPVAHCTKSWPPLASVVMITLARFESIVSRHVFSQRHIAKTRAPAFRCPGDNRAGQT
jgi:hypothetical protein